MANINSADPDKYEHDLWAKLADRETWAKTAAQGIILASSSEALTLMVLGGFETFRKRAAIGFASQEFTPADFQTMFDIITAEVGQRHMASLGGTH